MSNLFILLKNSFINSTGHKIKGRLIMKIAAIVAASCFFFPMFTVSCAWVNVGSVSMADLTFKRKIQPRTAIMIIMTQMKKKMAL